MRKLFVLSVTASIAFAGLAGCGSKSSNTPADTAAPAASSDPAKSSGVQKVVLDAVVSKPEATDGYNALAKKFNELNPNIEIKFSGQSTYKQTLQSRLAANNPPDLMAVPGGNYGMDLAKAGQLMDLTDQQFLSQIRDGVADAQKYNGKVYSLPVDMASQGFIYNKDTFSKAGIAQPPKTWAELIDDCKKLQASGITPIVFSGKDAWTLSIAVMTLAAPLSYGVDPQFDMHVVDGSKSFAGPEWTQAMKYYDELKTFANQDISSLDYGTANQMVATGKAAMSIQGIWAVSAMKQFNPNAQLQFFNTPLGEKPTLILGPDLTLGVSSKTKHKEEALKFLQFMTSKDAVDIWTSTVKTISAVKGSSMEFDPVVKDVNSYLQQNVQTYPLPNHMWFKQNVWTDWGAKLQDYNAGKINAAESQKALDNSLKQAYNDFK